MRLEGAQPVDRERSSGKQAFCLDRIPPVRRPPGAGMYGRLHSARQTGATPSRDVASASEPSEPPVLRPGKNVRTSLQLSTARPAARRQSAPALVGRTGSAGREPVRRQGHLAWTRNSTVRLTAGCSTIERRKPRLAAHNDSPTDRFCRRWVFAALTQAVHSSISRGRICRFTSSIPAMSRSASA